jgi:outer membrane biogenesis lipoprotein LolB
MAFAVSVSLVLSGCTGMTSAQIAKEMEPQRAAAYQQTIQAKAEITKQVMFALQKVQRGGMKIEIGPDGKVKSIAYTEHLDADILKQALQVPVRKERRVKSGLEESATLLSALAGIAIPVGAMYFGYKVAKSNNSVDKSRIAADVEITKSNNDMTKSMYKDFTDVTAGKSIVVEPSYPPEYIIQHRNDGETTGD